MTGETLYQTNDTSEFSPFAPYPYEESIRLDGKNRYERALIILQGVNNIRKVPHQTAWKVKSQTNPTTYYVEKQQDGSFTCNCPDCILHKNECKHIIAVKLALDSIKPRASKQKRDWKAYNKGVCDEFRYFEKYLRELTNLIEEAPNKRGRPSIPVSELAFLTINRVAHQLSSRRGAGLTESDEVGQYNYSSTLKFLQSEKATGILRELLHATAKPFVQIESSFSIDASGFNTRCYHEWCSEKWGTYRKRDFVKCHLVVGNYSTVITDAVITDETVADIKMFDELIDTTSGQFNVKKVCADAGYVSDESYKKIAQMDAEPLIMFKVTDTPEGKCPSWKKAFANLVTTPREFYMEYRERNNVETTFGAIKDKYGESLKSKGLVSQRNEVYCKLIAYNIALMIRMQNEIKVLYE